MKNNYLNLALGLMTALSLPAVSHAQLTACGNKGDKVLVCHVPPGNPANAHTICVSPNAVPAHYPDRTKHHNDFLGDCFSGCIGMKVVDYAQGMAKFSAVPADRSDVSKVLGVPDGNNAPGGFFSLGFGGWIIVEMDGGILDRAGNDLRVYETTFGPRSCDSYPEYAEVSVSPDMLSWYNCGTVCQDGSVDFTGSGFDWIRFVKVTDVSNKDAFPAQEGNVDGFDLDGIQCIPFGSSPARLAESGHQEGTTFLTVFPNPAEDLIGINFDGSEQGETVQIQIVDHAGRVVLTEQIVTGEGHHLAQFNVASLSSGIYMMVIRGDRYDQTIKVVKN